MREIEYRFWDVEGKQMWSWEEMKEFLEGEPSQTLFKILSGDHWIPMQFTGLCDSKGNKLFEGDLMKWTSTDTDGSLMKQIDEIKWSKYGWICGKDLQCLADYLCFDPSYENLELFGNIHEVNHETTL